MPTAAGIQSSLYAISNSRISSLWCACWHLHTAAFSASIFSLLAIPACLPKASLTISQEKKCLQHSCYFNTRFGFSIISEQFDLKCASGTSTSLFIAGMGTGLDLALSTYRKPIHLAWELLLMGASTCFMKALVKFKINLKVLKGIETLD